MDFKLLPSIDEILLPINASLPCGVDLREDSSPNSVYYALKDVRNSARRKERELSDEDTEENTSRTSDWKLILEQVPTLLQYKTKDLELTAWYIEALLRFYGFKGLAMGFDLATKLLQNYQHQIFPQDEDGLETTLAPLIGLNGIDSDGALITPIGSVTIFRGHNGSFAAWQYEQAVELEKVTDETKKNQRIKSGAVTLESVSIAAKESSSTVLLEQYKDLVEAINAYGRLVVQLDSLDPDLIIPTSNIKNRLQKCKTAFLALVAETVLPKTDLENDESHENLNESEQPIGDIANKSTGGLNRKKALNMLSEIAKYFRQTEPHSPISYTLEQAVRWSEMTLPELLEELITDAAAKHQFHKFTGILNTEND